MWTRSLSENLLVNFARGVFVQTMEEMSIFVHAELNWLVPPNRNSQHDQQQPTIFVLESADQITDSGPPVRPNIALLEKVIKMHSISNNALPKRNAVEGVDAATTVCDGGNGAWMSQGVVREIAEMQGEKKYSFQAFNHQVKNIVPLIMIRTISKPKLMTFMRKLFSGKETYLNYQRGSLVVHL